MGCNSMQPGNKFNQHLMMQMHPELNVHGSDAMLFPKQLGYHDMELDSLLADAGYNVKSSDLALVAQRLEQLESLCAAQDAGLISNWSSGTVHHNPSDLAGWLDSMIDGLGPPGSDGDSAIFDCAFQQQGPLPYGIEDDFWDSSSVMGYCAMDQSSCCQQPGNGAPLATTVPKQSEVIADRGQLPMERCNPSVSELIKDAIGHHGVASTASGPKYTTKEYSGNMMLGNGVVGEFQQYKVVEDQVSSNKLACRNQNQGMVCMSGFSGGIGGQGQSGLSECKKMHILQQPPQRMGMGLQPRPPFQHPQQIKPLLQHASHDYKPAGAAPTSPQSSNGRVSSQGSHRHEQQSEVGRQEVTVKAVSSPSAMSSSSPGVPYQERSGIVKKEAGYGHAIVDKLPPCQPNVAQQPVACVDANDEGAQEPGIRLVYLLMACAEAIQNSELAAAVDMVREIKRLASSSSGAMAKVATLFVEALARRIYGANIEDWASLSQADPLSETLYSNFYEACPYLKFAHFAANQAILEAFEGHKFVHVIDFNLMQGLQWPALIQALALRAGGPPHLRMTGIGPPQPDNKDVLQEIGMKLAQLASSVNVEFSFRGVVATKLDDVKPWMLEAKEGEAIAVISIFQLHRLLHCANPKSGGAPIDEVLMSIKRLSPKIVTVVEQEANHNGPVFLERFVEALHYYSTMFDSLEACFLHPQCSEMAYTEMYLGREIVNIVACEGMARIERHEPLLQWRQRMLNAGFQPLHLGSNAFKQASMSVKLFSGEGYTVEENKGCLMLGWHSRPLIAASAWQCG